MINIKEESNNQEYFNKYFRNYNEKKNRKYTMLCSETLFSNIKNRANEKKLSINEYLNRIINFCIENDFDSEV